ncbi:MAG TPA: calcium/sodium antiporter [Zoogloea sp.]|uniref:calcium/sodium antiporter n=1 Tax=Caldilinea sp. TaxID=2293560 RepID=UPI002CD979D2|nr:calcium/sodium antiporter [Zoogloea sp.]HQY94519.1 calcium/sodium antiporter [Caldilinea sp.]HRA69056.1 calcium/sodium antiporter [Caldilinea sp.]
METLWAVVQFAAGFVLLVGGAELLIRGASRIALRLGIQPIVVGLTVVAFGTSMPELLVSVTANLSNAGGGDIAIGNIVGSNIANLGLILGLCGSAYALGVNRHIVMVEYPLLIGVTIVFSAMLLSGALVQWQGVLLVAGMIAFIGWNILTARRQYTMAHAAQENLEVAVTVDAKIARPSEQPWFDVLLIMMGLGGLVLGSDWLVSGARTIALVLGVSDMVIGLTLVAVGTSLPEAATSLVATFRGQGDLAIGNVVGSNLFNMLGIAGLTAAIKPLTAPSGLQIDLAVMLALTALVYALVWNRPHRVERWQGAILLILYAGYTISLFMRS